MGSERIERMEAAARRARAIARVGVRHLRRWLAFAFAIVEVVRGLRDWPITGWGSLLNHVWPLAVLAAVVVLLGLPPVVRVLDRLFPEDTRGEVNDGDVVPAEFRAAAQPFDPRDRALGQHARF